jgi:hypothetical protein
MTHGADAITDAEAQAAPPGVALQDGEIVILSIRPHWSGPLYTGLIPTLVLGLALAVLSSVRTTPMPARITGFLAALALAPLLLGILRYALRRYVLTDRRVIVRDGMRHQQVALSSVKRIDVEERVREAAPGDVTFRSDEGILVWSRAPEAREVRRIASEAVERYGRL